MPHQSFYHLYFTSLRNPVVYVGFAASLESLMCTYPLCRTLFLPLLVTHDKLSALMKPLLIQKHQE